MAQLGKSDQRTIDDTNIATVTYMYELTIADGATVSDSFRMSGDSLIGFTTPATFEPTSMQVQVSFDGITWKNLSGVAYTVTTNTAYEVTPQSVYGWPFVRFSVNSAPSGADRVVQVMIKKI